jgi:hypothetical protein
MGTVALFCDVSRLRHLKSPYLHRLILILILIGYFFASSENMNDFLTFFEWGQAWRSGNDIFAPTTATGMYVFYLPIFSPLMGLISYLPYGIASAFWFVLKISLYISFIKTIKAVALDIPKRFLWITLLVFSGLIDSDFRLGQINSIVMITVFLVFLSAKSSIMKGLFYTISILKVTPLIFSPLLLLQKGSRAILFWTLSFSLFLLSIVCLQTELNVIALLKGWINISIRLKMEGNESLILANQSLFAALCRYGMDSQTAKILTTVSALAVVGMSCFFLFKSRLFELKRWEIFSFFTCLMLLFSPDTRPVHEIYLLPAFLCLLLYSYSKQGMIRWLAICNCTVFFVLSSCTNSDLVTTDFSNALLAFNLHTLVIILWASFFCYIIFNPSHSQNETPHHA